MAVLHDIVVDASHPAAVARFWAAALDGYSVAPYDDAELARLRASGIAGPEDDPFVVVVPRDGGPRLGFQLVPESKRGKNRVHLDLRAADVTAEITRLTALGAKVLARYEEHILLADIEGNEFCLSSSDS
jgi:Glyoxalase-like domain